MNFTQAQLSHSKRLQARNTTQIKKHVLDVIQMKHPKKITMNFLRVWVDQLNELNLFVVDVVMPQDTLVDLAEELIEELIEKYPMEKVMALLNRTTQTDCRRNYQNPF